MPGYLTRDRARRRQRLASETAEQGETVSRLSRRRAEDRVRHAARTWQETMRQARTIRRRRRERLLVRFNLELFLRKIPRATRENKARRKQRLASDTATF